MGNFLSVKDEFLLTWCFRNLHIDYVDLYEKVVNINLKYITSSKQTFFAVELVLPQSTYRNESILMGTEGCFL